MARRRRMSNSELRAVVEWQLVRASGMDGDEASENRKDALDSYYGRQRGDEVPGRSTARSQDVADMVESVIAQIMPSFDFDQVVAFEPNGEADVDQSRLESRVCNYMLMDRNRGYTIIQEALRDALLLRNGVLKIFVDERIDTQTQRFEGLSPIELLQVEEPNAPAQEVELLNINENADESFDVTVVRTTTFRALMVVAVDPNNFLTPVNFDSIFLETCDFVAERQFWTRSELVSKGFPRKVVDELAATTLDTKIDATARNRNEVSTAMDATDPSLDLVEVYECYMRVDFDQDGIAERRRILFAGGTSSGTVLENVPFSFVPYASGTPFLQAHRYEGMSLFDKLAQVEAIKTSTLRQYLDNLEQTNNRRLVVVDGMVNMDDAVASRPGGLIRAESLDAVRALEISDIGPSSQNLLNYMDKVRSERGGASLDLQAAELQIAGETAHGVERQFSSRELLAQLMTRTIGETLIRETFLQIHKTLRNFFPEAIEVNLGGDFVSVDPTTWQPRDRVKILAGLSHSERQQKAQALAGVLGQQEKLFQAGMSGILVDLQTYHDTLLDWGASAGLQNPARYWVDPRSQASQQAQQAAQQRQQQQAQQEQATQQALFQTQIQMQQMEQGVEIFKHATKLKFDYWDATLKSEIEELRITTEETELQSDQETGRERAKQDRSGPRAA